ncbi:hypothetical protein [Kordia jejudonensis]|uniref:hypothetical protein n=1 Tax=Kordia jejudonensis TaxID=1348245 RepID=UPI0006293AA1|nr:hypothetical protein [Kordia jejudonensis]
MLKNLLLTFLFITVITTHNSNTALEGVWIASYEQFSNSENPSKKERPQFGHILEIKGNSYRLKKFENRLIQSEGMDRTANFTLKEDQIIFDDNEKTTLNINLNKDSLTIDYGNVKVTYKKLPKQHKKINWNPTGNLYKSEANGKKLYEDFANDSQSYLYFVDETDVYEQIWQIMQIGNHSFLLLESHFDNTVLLIDAVDGNTIYLTDYLLAEKKYVLEKVTKKQKKPAALLGTWKLVNIENVQDLDKDGAFNPLSKNRIEKIIIKKDSIHILNPFFKQKSAWKYYEDGNYIFLKDMTKLAKVVELESHSLLLEMNLSETDISPTVLTEIDLNDLNNMASELSKKKQFIFTKE